MESRVDRVRIAHITDAHVAPSGRPTATLKHRSCEVLSDLVEQCRNRRVDLTLFGGDNIDNRGDGERDLRAFVDIADRGTPWVAVLGNHEAPRAPRAGSVSKEDCLWALAGHGVTSGCPNFSVSVRELVRVIGIDTVLTGTSGGYVSPATMSYLAREIRRATEPHIVVLGHHPLHRSWEPHRLDAWDREYLVANRQEVIALLSSAPRVRAYLCGHHHASRIQRIGGRVRANGFYHLLTASPVAFPHAARILEVAEDGIRVEPLLPTVADLADEGRRAVLTGRKAQRYAFLDTRQNFLDYLAGQDSDNRVVLPHEVSWSQSQPFLAAAV